MEDLHKKFEDMKNDAPHCQGCKDWLKYCNAECCRSMRFSVSFLKGKAVSEGDVIPMKMRLSLDQQRYYSLRGYKYVHGILFVKLNKFQIVGPWIYVFEDCSALNAENQCSIHETKPIMCKDLSLDNVKDSRFYLTPNCLFKWKR